jgi:hypothetical protein
VSFLLWLLYVHHASADFAGRRMFLPATIMILPCTTSPLAQRVLISNMFMGKSEGVASGALAGPFFTLRPQRLGVFRIELCFSKVMVLSPHNKRPQKVPRTRLFSPTPSFQAHRSAQSGTGRTQARHSASRNRFLRYIGECAEFHARQALRF